MHPITETASNSAESAFIEAVSDLATERDLDDREERERESGPRRDAITLDTSGLSCRHPSFSPEIPDRARELGYSE